MQHYLHTLERFATSWTLRDVVAATLHATHLTLRELQERLQPVATDPFDAKLQLVVWLRHTQGADAVDRVEHLLKGSASLGSALGDAGYTLEQLQQLLEHDDEEREPLPDIFAWLGGGQRRFHMNVWRRHPEVLARQIVLWRLQRFLDQQQEQD